MRVRHRIPSIFNLSMVDVLCCALGCFILLWLVGAKTSKDDLTAKTVSLNEAQDQLEKERTSATAVETDLQKKRTDLETQAALQADAIHRLEGELNDARARSASLETDLEARGKDLTAARTGADDLSRKLADAGGRIKDLQAVADLLPGLRADLKAARDQYAADETKLRAAEKDMAQRSQDLDETARKLLASQKNAAQHAQDLDSVGKTLAALQAAKTRLEADMDDRNKELALLRPFKDKWAADEEQVLALRKDLADARRGAEALQTEKTKWQTEATRIKTEADNRFAGITLTGSRVVFLVDMSGSMVYLDDDTPAPQKWVEVRNTVAQIMRSLPTLQKYQIVAFSDKSQFPLGGAGKWFDYDPKTSADLVLQTLAAVKPEGGTNMYDAMQTVFGMRSQGLDAVYFLSDGLPNLGEGVRPDEINKLTELERGARLSQVIRKTLKTNWNRDIDGKRVRINTVGFFYESPDVGAFLWALARENDGSFVGMSKP